MSLSLASAGIRRASLGELDLNASLGNVLLVPKARRPAITVFSVSPASALSGVDVSSPVTWTWATTGATRVEVQDPGGGVRHRGGPSGTYSEVPPRSAADLDDDLVRVLVAYSAADLQSRREGRFKRLDPPTVSVGTPRVQTVLRNRVMVVPITAFGDPFPDLSITPEIGFTSRGLDRRFIAGRRDETVTKEVRATRVVVQPDSVDYTVTARNSEGEASATFTGNW